MKDAYLLGFRIFAPLACRFPLLIINKKKLLVHSHGCMALVMLVMVLNYSGVEIISIDVDMLVLATSA